MKEEFSTHQIEKYIVHPKWDPESIRYNDDIALIKLKDSVTFSDSIKPVCLPFNDLTIIDNGISVGWGSIDDYYTLSSTPKIAGPHQILSEESCIFDRDSLLSYISWKDSFCVHAEPFEICRGSSGKGLYVEYNKIYYLIGIVSSTIRKRCSEKNHIISTDIIKYLDFIKANL